MLAFDEPALARLAIAATAVPREERGAWLRDLAERVDPAPPLSPAQRKRRASRLAHYYRHLAGRRVLKVEIDIESARKALAILGVVPGKLEDAISDLIDETVAKIIAEKSGRSSKQQ